MLRLLVTFFIILTLALVGVWLAELDGTVILNFPTYEVEVPLLTGVIVAALVIVALLLLWKLLAGIWALPARLRRSLRMRRRRKAREAIVNGLIAAEAGETGRALSLAARAERLSGDRALVQLLEARAALVAGEDRRAAETYKAMLSNERTRLLGLRGLYDLALKEGREAEAHELARQARALSGEARWAADGVLHFQTREGAWDEALATVQAMADQRLLERARARRLRAVLLTAKALELPPEEAEAAYSATREAHALAPNLVPAAAKLAELARARGELRRARKTLEAGYQALPHPDLAEAYLQLAEPATAQGRYRQALRLAEKKPEHRESELTVAAAAIDAGAYEEARARLLHVLQAEPCVRAFQLMAELEEAESGDIGKAREWLSRALDAPRDPAWVAEGVVSDEWAPVGPVTGRLDAYEWRVPPSALAVRETLSAEEIEAINSRAEAARPPVIVEVPAGERPGKPDPDDSSAQAAPAAASSAQPQQQPRPQQEHQASGAPAPEGQTAPRTGAAGKTGEDAAPGRAASQAQGQERPEAAPAQGAERPAPAAGPAGDGEKARSAARTSPEAELINLPRQPDDPGLDEGEEEDQGASLRVPDMPRRH